MNLFRVIAVVLLIWLVVYMVKRAVRQRQLTRAERDTRSRRAEQVVRCARCGVHVPRSAALQDDERFYCSPEHRDEDRD